MPTLKPAVVAAALAGCLAAGLALGVWLRVAESPPAAGWGSLQLQTLQGEKANIFTAAGNKAGKPILVNFWATWCKPCVKEMPLLQQAENAAFVVGISNEDAATISSFLRQNNITYSIFRSSGDIFSFLQENGNPSGGLPYTVLLAANGDIINKKLGEFNDINEIRQFIAR